MLLCIETGKIMESFDNLTKTIKELKNDKEIYKFLVELLTENEINVLSKRWRILNMLKDGCTQREISSELGVSLCKVTRGSKILKDKKSIIAKILKG